MTFYRAFPFFIVFFISMVCTAQMKNKDYSNIMNSTNIYEIDAFLRDAHPDEPRRSILRPKLIKMLKEYIKDAHPADQRVKEFQEKLTLLQRRPSTKISFDEMNDIIKQKQIAKFREQLAKNSPESYTTLAYVSGAGSSANDDAGTASGFVDTEAEEFNMLMNVDAQEHKRNTVKVLNSLFDNDPSSTESIVMIENKSECNIIMRIEGVGNTKYRLAIPGYSENTIVVAKGDYLFTSLVCGAQYASQKTVQKAIIVALGDSPRK